MKKIALLFAVTAAIALSAAGEEAARQPAPDSEAGGCGRCCQPAPADTTAATSPKPYPLQTCLISGEKLGEMGAPYVFVEQGQEIKLCCKGCLKDFRKEPAKYLKKISARPA